MKPMEVLILLSCFHEEMIKLDFKTIIKDTSKAVLACAVSGLGVGMIIQYDHGVDPLSLFQLGLSTHSGLSVGTIALIYNIILLILSFIVNKNKLGIGTLIYTISLGFFMDTSISLLPELDGSSFLIGFFIGHFILCIGNAGLLYLDFGLSSLDAIIQWGVKKFHIRYGFIKVGTDIFFACAGILLGSCMKWGSLYIMFSTGFIVDILVEKYQSIRIKSKATVKTY